ncbi:MAG: MmcQ/YjbR family DNA-binding protein [Dehalococcoidia bacterium]
MNQRQLTALLGGFAGAEAGYPFGPGAQVWKVGGKIFAIVGEDSRPLEVSLKCDPDLAEELRAAFPELVRPGYHLNKRHWNTVRADAPRAELREWVEHSYELVFGSLPRRVREAITVAASVRER